MADWVTEARDARKPRVLVEGGIYHVSNRFASGEAVVADPEESQEFIVGRGTDKRQR